MTLSFNILVVFRSSRGDFPAKNLIIFDEMTLVGESILVSYVC